MRMRHRPNLAPRMEKCASLLISDPSSLRGNWLSLCPECRAVHLELGCGKGRFTVDTAAASPDILCIAVEKSADALIIALERVQAAGLKNVRFLCADVASLGGLFDPGEVERIYINFCDPWPKSRDAKFRLTAPGFLRLYAELLPPGGRVFFKTDNSPLFDWSISCFTQEGWALHDLTGDLHSDGICGIMTDYEARFHARGVKINRLEAERTPDTLTTAAPALPRLRGAALSDARLS